MSATKELTTDKGSWMSVDQVAEYTGLTKQAVLYKVHAGHLPGYRVGHAVRLVRKDVEDYFKPRLITPKAPRKQQARKA